MSEAARGQRDRKRLGCLCVILSLLLWWSGSILLESNGYPDGALKHRVQFAMGCEWTEISGIPDGYPLVKESLGNGVFADRLRTVDGWDQIVLVAPRSSGEAVADDPALTSCWLRHRIRNVDDNTNEQGEVVDGMYRLLAIRGQKVVVDFNFHYGQEALPTVLVQRTP